MIWWSERTRLGPLLPLRQRRQAQAPAHVRRVARRAHRRGRFDRRACCTSPASAASRARIRTTRTLYRVNLDGTGLRAARSGRGDAQRRALSPNKKWIVDNCSRIDMVPKAVLRDATGKVVMDLETMDVSRLQELGWKPPERFVDEGGGRRDRHLRQHLEAVRLRFDEEVSDHRQRLSGPADRSR